VANGLVINKSLVQILAAVLTSTNPSP